MPELPGPATMRLVLLIVTGATSVCTVKASDPVSFNRDIRPILSENCFACHGFDSKHRKAGLRLDTFEGATLDQDGVKAVVPGKLEESELLARIESDDDEMVMPPRSSHKPRLTAEQQAKLKAWVEQGAKYEPHWAFILPVRPAVDSSCDSAIDFFIQKKLTEAGLQPSPEATPEKLIRRVSLDLTGLPPTVAEVDQFVAASAKDADEAYRALVDRLLASPHYGERWGRWWLDQARYADSNGYSIDAPRQIWKFRDWVIEALNADMPFDRFTVEQIAGDLLPDAGQSQKVATGFHRNTQINQEGGIDPEQFRIDSVFDRVATTGTVWLGLTVGCAQCHDHKFDPISQKEYYQLFAFLNNQDEPTLKVFDQGLNVGDLTAEFNDLKTKITAYMKDHAEDLAKWEAGLSPEAKKGLAAEVKKALGAASAKRNFDQQRALFAGGIAAEGEFRRLNDRYSELDTTLNQGVSTLVMKELEKPRKTCILIKGDFTRPADEVSPGTLAVLPPLESRGPKSDRLDLARWLVSPKNPLTSRVIANRVWQQYFGRGLVETENDFGMQGSPPSHPDLLDWLAVEFMEKGWSLKALHRQIVTSHVYRQSSSDRPDLHEKDPHNYLLGRQQRLRLDAELVRDVELAASGLLSPKIGGPPVYPPIPDGVMGQGQVKRVWAVSKGEDRYRRGLYTFIYRASPPPELIVFDAPDGFSTCTRRIRSNTPLQALTLLNDAGFFEFAAALEKIIRRDGLETAFRRCTARPAAPDELAVLQKLDTLSAARVLLNLDETLTRE
ncbi:PSD1 and planctomycete cytochrome C domain-containing protein [Paludisphaera rhizosphaerae]|uniref:PSD1 and planctomycete cytochrome C domain-containing protein n=1 Tax=Paludisphaera rhizosphaerae TaxID=2711216 RepID=UPI001F10078A|nr:PSD1 and planctomycete cytochrome C domain-containing protein [Paludisphaera rhizosphaerae]